MHIITTTAMHTPLTPTPMHSLGACVCTLRVQPRASPPPSHRVGAPTLTPARSPLGCGPARCRGASPLRCRACPAPGNSAPLLAGRGGVHGGCPDVCPALSSRQTEKPTCADVCMYQRVVYLYVLTSRRVCINEVAYGRYCRVFAQRRCDPVTGEPIIMVSHQDVTNLRKVCIIPPLPEAINAPPMP